MAKKDNREQKRDRIERDLHEQLEELGIHGEHYSDLVDDYMALWDVKNKLIDDIEERGVSIHWSNGGGQSGYKKNDSVPELNKTNNQMLKILSELGLKATPKVVEEDDEEEM